MIKKINVNIKIKYMPYFKPFFPNIKMLLKKIPIHAALELVKTIDKEIPNIKKYIDAFLKSFFFNVIKDATQNGQIEFNHEPA